MTNTALKKYEVSNFVDRAKENPITKGYNKVPDQLLYDTAYAWCGVLYGTIQKMTCSKDIDSFVINKKLLLKEYKKRGGSAFTYEKALSILKKTGWLIQIRCPSDRGRWKWIYILNTKPIYDFLGTVSCRADGSIKTIDGKPVTDKVLPQDILDRFFSAPIIPHSANDIFDTDDDIVVKSVSAEQDENSSDAFIADFYGISPLDFLDIDTCEESDSPSVHNDEEDKIIVNEHIIEVTSCDTAHLSSAFVRTLALVQGVLLDSILKDVIKVNSRNFSSKEWREILMQLNHYDFASIVRSVYKKEQNGKKIISMESYIYSAIIRSVKKQI